VTTTPNTLVERDLSGLDRHGRTATGLDINGFYADGTCRKTGTRHSRLGLDVNGFDRNGFDSCGVHSATGTLLSPEGVTWDNAPEPSEEAIKNLQAGWFDARWRSWHAPSRVRSQPAAHEALAREFGVLPKPGQFDPRGFDRDGIHSTTGTLYDPDGYGWDGFDAAGVRRDGACRAGWSGKRSDRTPHKPEFSDIVVALLADWTMLNVREFVDVDRLFLPPQLQSSGIPTCRRSVRERGVTAYVRRTDGALSEVVHIAWPAHGSNTPIHEDTPLLPPVPLRRYAPLPPRHVVYDQRLGSTIATMPTTNDLTES
jgi:hypothetical protein